MSITQTNTFPRERFNITLLAIIQSLFNITAITVTVILWWLQRSRLQPISMAEK
jgi:hypothetical protein